MLIYLEALRAVQVNQTMLKAGEELRISQSAISKRISALETICGYKLVNKDGRRVKLTAQAIELISKVRPHLKSIEDVINSKVKQQNLSYILGVSESILGSWGAKTILPMATQLNINFELHTHRSPIIQSKVEEGLYDLGICAGKLKRNSSLISEALNSEEMVLIGKIVEDKPIYSIEKTSSTWKNIKSKVTLSHNSKLKELESFFTIANLSKRGFGAGIVPVGIARTLGIKSMQSFKPKVFRDIQIIYKKSKLEDPVFKDFIENIKL